jgi:hypothetical protein
MTKSEKAYAAYRAYLDKFNAAHPNNDQYCPKVVSEWNCPSTEGAVSVGNQASHIGQSLLLRDLSVAGSLLQLRAAAVSQPVLLLLKA